MSSTYNIVEIKIPIQTSNLFIKLNNKKKGKLANTQKRIVDGKSVLDNTLLLKASNDIEDCCV